MNRRDRNRIARTGISISTPACTTCKRLRTRRARHFGNRGNWPGPLLTAVEKSECPRKHNCHYQTPGSPNEHIGAATDVELCDGAHKQISCCDIYRAPEHGFGREYADGRVVRLIIVLHLGSS